jgi:hypothetical protein
MDCTIERAHGSPVHGIEARLIVVESKKVRSGSSNSRMREVWPPLYESRLELSPRPDASGTFTGRFEVGDERLPYYQDLNAVKIGWRIEIKLETPTGTYEEMLPLRMIPRTEAELPPPAFEHEKP